MTYVYDKVLGADVQDELTCNWTIDKWIEELTNLKNKYICTITDNKYTEISNVFVEMHYYNYPKDMGDQDSINLAITFKRKATPIEELVNAEKIKEKLHSEYTRYLSLYEKFKDYVPE